MNGGSPCWQSGNCPRAPVARHHWAAAADVPCSSKPVSSAPPLLCPRSLVAILVFRFVVRVQLGETAGWVTFVFLQVR